MSVGKNLPFPLTPIWDPDKKTGAISTGNTPGVTPVCVPDIIAIADAINDGTNLNEAFGIDVVGSYAYVAAELADRLVIVDISDPTTLSIVGSVTDALLNGARVVVKDGNYAYVACYSADRVVAVDVSNPAAPVIVGNDTNASLNGAQGITKDGGYCYATAGIANAVSVVEVIDPTDVFVVGSVTDATDLDNPYDIVKDGNYCYVACYDGNALTVVDVSTPTAPAVVGTVSAASLAGATGLVKDGNYCYVACANATNGGGAGALTVVDVTTPTAPAVVGSVADTSFGDPLYVAWDVVKDGDYCYVSTNEAYLVIVDVSDPTTPTVVDSLFNVAFAAGRGIDKSGDYVYLADGVDSFLSIEIGCA